MMALVKEDNTEVLREYKDPRREEKSLSLEQCPTVNPYDSVQRNRVSSASSAMMHSLWAPVLASKYVRTPHLIHTQWSKKTEKKEVDLIF